MCCPKLGHCIVTGFTTRDLIKKRNLEQPCKLPGIFQVNTMKYVEIRLTYTLSWIGVPRKWTPRLRFTGRKFIEKHCQGQHW